MHKLFNNLYNNNNSYVICNLKQHQILEVADWWWECLYPKHIWEEISYVIEI